MIWFWFLPELKTGTYAETAHKSRAARSHALPHFNRAHPGDGEARATRVVIWSMPLRLSLLRRVRRN